jgi:hypothetical protein
MNLSVTNSQIDTSLELLVDELTDRLQAGESIDLEAYADQHPDHAEQLRKLIPALEMMVQLKRSAVRGAARSSPPDRGPELELGELGDFRLLRVVGGGGMGIVYEAEQISLRRRVALKSSPSPQPWTPGRSSGSRSRPRPPLACTTRTSSRCTASAASAACTTTPCNSSTVRAWLR